MQSPGRIKRIARRNTLAVCISFSLVFFIPKTGFSGTQDANDARVDYASMQESILKFEDILNEAVSGSFSSSAFAVVQKAKGAYLNGYGISYSFLVNIHRAVMNTPFGQVRSRKAVSLEEKMRRIEQLKDNLIQLLQSGGSLFPQLRKDERISIVAFVEDRNFPGEPNANKTIVISAFKKDLDEMGNRLDRAKEFKQRIKIVEY